MPTGPGIYDNLCTTVRLTTQARGVIVIIIDGSQGSGFSAQLAPELQAGLPDVLEATAQQMRASFTSPARPEDN